MIDEKKLIESSTWYPNILFKEELTWKDGWNNCNRDWMKRIDKLPKVILPDTTITGWIPCSERLPEKYGEYLCCDNCGNVIIAMPFENRDSDTRYCAESDNCYMWSCTAWMPLPEPYKGETE